MMQERLKHEEAIEVNNGVWWSARLRVVPLSEDTASLKGIKRGADKVHNLHFSLLAYSCLPTRP